MAKIQYNKLVRDKIKEIIISDGDIAQYKYIHSDEEYEKELANKLKEEALEFSEDNSIEELADVLEVCLAIMKQKNITEEQIKTVMDEKREKKGGFDKRLFLFSVIEKREE